MMKQWIEQTLPQQVEELQNLIRIPSVSRGEPKEGMPYGEEVHKALTYALDLANRLGFLSEDINRRMTKVVLNITLPCMMIQFLMSAPVPICTPRDSTLCCALPSTMQPSAMMHSDT